MIPLTLVANNADSRVGSDRLELLRTLIKSPSFDRLYSTDVIKIPPDHEVYAWGCLVDDCERVRYVVEKLCSIHSNEWRTALANGLSRSQFIAQATPLKIRNSTDFGNCQICLDKPAQMRETKLCRRHHARWRSFMNTYYLDGNSEDFKAWSAGQKTIPTYGPCRCAPCSNSGTTPLGMCDVHHSMYLTQGSPGRAHLPSAWERQYEPVGAVAPVSYDDESVFNEWCKKNSYIYRVGVIDLRGLAPLIKAEFQWGMYAHALVANRTHWEVSQVQRVVRYCISHNFSSMAEANDYNLNKKSVKVDAGARMICREIVDVLRIIYYSPADSKAAGFIETEHFGIRFKNSTSNFDLTPVTIPWLRDLLWDHLAEVMRSESCPRNRGTIDQMRRGCIELSAFLEQNVPECWGDPGVLGAEHAQNFAADQRRRVREGLPSLGICRQDGKPSKVTDTTRRLVFNAARKVMYRAIESGRASEIGIDVSFIGELPSGGEDKKKSRGPFSDEVAKALADEGNLQILADVYDRNDRGVRDIWETIVLTGRRCGEVLNLRLDCIGYYGSLPMLWHDQTKVGNYNEAIRIPEQLYKRLDERRAKTLRTYEARHGRIPSSEERLELALFPSAFKNPRGVKAISYGHFNQSFKGWVDGLNVSKTVAHQARHTMATNLLKAGATLTHIRKYLGHVSDRMAEHYISISHSELEDVLQSVWVAGPGAAVPGEVLSSGVKPLAREEALALAVDLSRRSTPSEGGFCTFQPVVNGSQCPWSLDCQNCDKFVMSGADLVYWRRKQEQWRSIAERAPDDATSDYLHQVFEPTARAIIGLEKVLDSLGLLGEALQLDMRRPQDYFHSIWSTNFRSEDLASLDDD